MGFLILYFLFDFQWAIAVSLTVGIAGLVSDAASRKIEWVWMKIALVLSYIVPTVLLGLIFFLILFPLLLLSKLANKDPLILTNRHKTYFVNTEKEFDKNNMEKTW